MSHPARKRGRPRSASSMSPAQRMRLYRARKAAVGLKSVSEWVPALPADGHTFSAHQLLDARSLALHCLTACRITADPALMEIARDNLRRWSARNADSPPRYLQEWEEVLSQPWPVVAAFITSFSNRAIRLRQSSPFAGVLSPEERNRIYEAFRS